GVFPIRSSSELATTGHRREENHRGAFTHGRLEADARAHVLAVDVDVHERVQLAVAVDARAECRYAGSQVLEELSHRRAGGFDLARAARLVTKHRRNSDDAQLFPR